jgi:hypothetical protein
MVAQSFGSFRKLERLAHGGYAIGSNAEIFKTASRQRHAQSPPANNLQTVKGLGILAENLVGNRRCHASGCRRVLKTSILAMPANKFLMQRRFR